MEPTKNREIGFQKERKGQILSSLLNFNVAISIVLFVMLYMITKIMVSSGFVIGLVFCAIPLMLAIVCIFFAKPPLAYYFLFVINYFVMGLSRYISGWSSGIVMDGMFSLCISILLVHLIFRRNTINWRGPINGLTLCAIIWVGYTFMELFNPQSCSSEAWATTIRGVSIYMLLVVVIVPLLLTKFKDVKIILYIWSVLSFCAILKALCQKYFGFDEAEKFWLFVGGGAKTHIIGYGIRYFSFFTDAANFGASMGMSMVVFSICALYFQSIGVRIWFLIVASLSAYCMIISGTRGALAVPFMGYTMLIILSKRKTLMVVGSVILLLSFCFLKYTYIGQDNAMIRRMRSALDPEDASLKVRTINKAKMKIFMADKPFGVGIGLGGVKAQRFAPYAYMSNIATDSWFVMIWVETGIVGLIIHISVLLYALLYGCYQVLHKIRDVLLKGIMIAMISGISGIIMASYGNEIFGSFPTGIIIYTFMAFIFMAPKFDEELQAQ